MIIMKFLLNSASLASCLLLIGASNAFAPRSNAAPPSRLFDTNTMQDAPATEAISSVVPNEESPIMEKLVDSIKFRYDLFQKAKGEGYDFKQSTACAIAGEYDATAVLEEVEDIIKSYPCVMFSWESSPSCKKAVDAFEKVGADVKIVRLDDPWDEGNPIRAEIGKMVGKSSVPMIFIDGEFVGGYDAGVSEDAPGILDMAFKGTLRPKLETAGAMRKADI
jgi:glutaredoxin 3